MTADRVIVRSELGGAIFETMVSFDWDSEEFAARCIEPMISAAWIDELLDDGPFAVAPPRPLVECPALATTLGISIGTIWRYVATDWYHAAPTTSRVRPGAATDPGDDSAIPEVVRALSSGVVAPEDRDLIRSAMRRFRRDVPVWNVDADDLDELLHKIGTVIVQEIDGDPRFVAVTLMGSGAAWVARVNAMQLPESLSRFEGPPG